MSLSSPSSSKTKQPAKKGTFKTKEHGKPSTSKGQSVETMEASTKESVLSFPLIKTTDNERMLPRYSAILNRTEEEGVGMEDLDALQLELEALLSAVVVRSRVLQEEIRVLNNAEEKRSGDSKKAKKSLGQIDKDPSSPGKGAKHHKRPMKKLKEIGSKSRESDDSNLTPPTIKFTKAKNIPTNSSTRTNINLAFPDHDHSDSSRHKIVVPKNDTPNKFWTSVEPYFADISKDDIRVIDELIKEHENDDEYQKVPPLGQHYSLRWVQEDLEKHPDGNSSKSKSRSASKSESGKRQDTGNPGPITQRLLSCLMEENIMVPSQEPPESKRSRGVENTKPTRSFTVASASSLERRVRKELEEQGLLDPSEPKDPADDEIFAELKRCQSELKTLCTHNMNQLKRLRKLAMEEMTRQELKHKLDAADSALEDAYRKVQSSRQKKIPPSKEDTDLVWKCLKERENIIKQLDNL